MAIITLTTDLGEKDFYAGAVKGQILYRLPQAHVVDITHLIKPFDIFHAAFVLGQAWRSFPAGTVHLVNVTHTESKDDRLLLIDYKGHYFIGYDNGWFSLAVHDMPEKVVALPADRVAQGTFLLRDVMVPAACALLQKQAMEQLGQPIRQIRELRHLEPNASDQFIRGNIVYIDHYGNAVTNIHQKLFDEVGQGRKFSIGFRRERLEQIYATYDAVSEGEKVAVFNAAGWLEIAINKGNAAQLLGLDNNVFLHIDFHQ